MKIEFNSDDELPLNKTMEIPSLIIAVRAVFHENKKYYRKALSDECLYKLQTMKKRVTANFDKNNVTC